MICAATTWTDPDLMKRFIDRAHCEFVIKDLGKLNYFFGLEVSYTSSGLFVVQGKYAHDIFQRAELLDFKPISTPLAVGEVLVSERLTFLGSHFVQVFVGALQYLTITRPDLSYAVNVINQVLNAPMDDHFLAVKRILRYVKGTVHHSSGVLDIRWGSILMLIEPIVLRHIIPRIVILFFLW